MSTSQSELQQRWLGPSAALNRFNQRQVFYAADSRDTEGHLSYGFRIGDIGLLVPASITSEILEPLPVSALPDAPDWFVGLCNLRGSVIPVYQIATFLGTGDDDQERTKLLVIGKGDSALGILVNGLPQPLKLAEEHLMTEMPPIPERLLESVTKAFLMDRQVWFEFDHDRLFSAIAQRAAEHSPGRLSR